MGLLFHHGHPQDSHAHPQLDCNNSLDQHLNPLCRQQHGGGIVASAAHRILIHAPDLHRWLDHAMGNIPSTLAELTYDRGILFWQSWFLAIRKLLLPAPRPEPPPDSEPEPMPSLEPNNEPSPDLPCSL